MASLAQFLTAQLDAAVRAATRPHQLVSGVVVSRSGAQFRVNLGGQTVGAVSASGLPLKRGDQVLVRQGYGQPVIVAAGPRNSDVSD